MWIFEVIYGGLLIIINGKKVNFKSHFFSLCTLRKVSGLGAQTLDRFLNKRVNQADPSDSPRLLVCSWRE